MGKLVIEDDGRPEIVMNGKTLAVNVFEVYFALRKIMNEVREDIPADEHVSERQHEYFIRLVAYLKGLGFGDVTFRMADLFDETIEDFATNLGKAKASAPTPV